MRYYQLFESKTLGYVINAANKAKIHLSQQSIDAINQWQQSNWMSGPLENAFKTNNDIAQNISDAFTPVKTLLHKLYGTHIKLYRGQRNFDENELDKNRLLFSWTTSEKTARYFGQNMRNTIENISDDDGKKIIDKFNKTGFVKIGKYKIARSKTEPNLFGIWNGDEFVTAHDDINEYVNDYLQSIRDITDRANAYGKVVSKNMPIDDIVWIVNDLNCQEFICKSNPL